MDKLCRLTGLSAHKHQDNGISTNLGYPEKVPSSAAAQMNGHQAHPEQQQARKQEFQRHKTSSTMTPSIGLHDCLAPISRSRLSTLAQIGEDWLYLALLGIIMALISFSMDTVITMFLNTRLWLSEELSHHGVLLQYLAWCLTSILLVTFSSGFVHLCSPTVSKTYAPIITLPK